MAASMSLFNLSRFLSLNDGGLRTVARRDLFCIARKNSPASFTIHIQLLGLCAKVFNESFEHMPTDTPMILRRVLIEYGMHYLN